MSFKQGDRCIHFLTSLKAHLRQTGCQPSPQLVDKSEATFFNGVFELTGDSADEEFAEDSEDHRDSSEEDVD
mgnify:CR=1 FL=1